MSLGYCEPVTVLLLSGQNKHQWQKSSHLIERFLDEESALIDVRVTEIPQSRASSDFKGVDVILSHWNAFPSKSVKDPVTECLEEARKAYVDFVRRGGG